MSETKKRSSPDEKIVAILALAELRSKFVLDNYTHLEIGKMLGLSGTDNAIYLKVGKYLKALPDYLWARRGKVKAARQWIINKKAEEKRKAAIAKARGEAEEEL